MAPVSRNCSSLRTKAERSSGSCQNPYVGYLPTSGDAVVHVRAGQPAPDVSARRIAAGSDPPSVADHMLRV
jgi:hypothetical protein